MKAIVCKEFGPPEKLVVEEWPDLEPTADGVVIDVHACGLNFVDTLMIQGLYQIRPEPPFVPGGEVAGVVAAVGADVEDVKVGDRVLYMCGMNGFAAQVLAPAKRVLRLPEGLDFDRATALMQSYCTALHALSTRGDVKEGETVLVLGAAGGVGSAAIDVARAFGAKVIAAAGADEKVQACLDRGAFAGVNYSTEDLKKRVKEIAPGGVDIVYDPIGDRYAEPALRTLAPNGRFLVIGFAAGEIPSVPFNLMLLKQCQVVGVNWGAWSGMNPKENAALFDELISLYGEGRIDPPVPQTWPLEDAGAALRALMDRKVIGKGALTMQG